VPFASLQNNRIIRERWWRAREGTAARQRLEIPASHSKTQVAPMVQRFDGSRRVGSPKIFAGS
jgi:hypothetical protein